MSALHLRISHPSPCPFNKNTLSEPFSLLPLTKLLQNLFVTIHWKILTQVLAQQHHNNLQRWVKTSQRNQLLLLLPEFHNIQGFWISTLSPKEPLQGSWGPLSLQALQGAGSASLTCADRWHEKVPWSSPSCLPTTLPLHTSLTLGDYVLLQVVLVFLSWGLCTAASCVQLLLSCICCSPTARLQKRWSNMQMCVRRGGKY